MRIGLNLLYLIPDGGQSSLKSSFREKGLQKPDALFLEKNSG